MMKCTSDLKFLEKKKKSAAKWINELWTVKDSGK